MGWNERIFSLFTYSIFISLCYLGYLNLKGLEFPGGPVVSKCLLEAQLQSLVWELRSH